jgi:hypothetical protein
MPTGHRVIEVVMPLDLVHPDKAILPTEFTDPNGPTVFEITPVVRISEGKSGPTREISFRISFEPDNKSRRKQPLRNTLEGEFPNDWKYGDPLVGDVDASAPDNT